MRILRNIFTVIYACMCVACIYLPYEIDKKELSDQDYINMGRINENRHNYEEAAKCYQKAISIYPSLAAYWSIASVYENQGKYKEAIAAKKLQLTKESNSASSAYCYQIIGNLYLSQGNDVEAKRNYDIAINEMEDFDKSNPAPFGIIHKIGMMNVTYAHYYLWTGEYEFSIKYREDLLTGMKSNKRLPPRLFDIACQENPLAQAYYFSGNVEQAEILAQHAAETSGMFTEYYIPAVTMLGHIAEYRGDNEKALSHYQLGWRRIENYQTKTEKAELLKHIGRVYYKLGKNEDAHAAFTETKHLRYESATQTHPDYADVLREMSELSVDEKDLTSATLQAEESLKILDTALVPTHPRITPTLIALSSIYELTGKSEQATPFKARIETILQKPLGPWKEDFMETAAFYTEQLKKANKPDAAQYLEQLQARQKDKR